MPDNNKKIYVYYDNNGIPALMGYLYADGGRGKELFSFEYASDWIRTSDYAFSLDPDLLLYSGRQYVPDSKVIFGIFSDSCPDRWGRLLMNRREAVLAKHEGRKPAKLMESDYLLGVYDEARIGALRFKLNEDGDFLSKDTELSTPPWTTLRSLEAASLAFENDENRTEEKWLRQLLAPGSSLGGARPKATVKAPDGSLWIAKFPSRHDEWNSGAWEMVAHELAVLCGINVPEARLQTFSKKGGTYIVKRFDRNGRIRIHFSSAMTLLGKTDGASSDDGSGYLDIAAFIKSNGSAPKKDLLELWKRIVFSIAISNTDDHLRNHAFILEDNGWRLSPMFDVNPNIYGNNLSLNITENDSSIQFDVALEAADRFGLGQSEARDIADSIKKTVEHNWRAVASKLGLGKNAISHMEPAFDMRFK